ncbi:MAG TPA: glycosyltransferase [Nocardioides sp.]|nr:glycosyltransferase [Nocardioides sp.]
MLADLGTATAPPDPLARDRLLSFAKRLREGPAAPPELDWAEVGARPRRPGRTSVVVVAGEPRPTARTVLSVLATSGGRDVEVLVIDRASPPHVALGLQAAFLDHAEVEVVRVAGDVTAAAATDLGVARASGDVVLVLAPHVVVRRGALAGLVAALEDPEVAGAQPVVLGPDDAIVSAGVAVDDELGGLTPLLAGLPADDARRLDGERLEAISSEAMALRVEDVAAAGGLSFGRLLELRPGGFRVAAGARVSSSVTSPDQHAPRPVLAPRVARSDTGRRRWSLKLPSPPGALGDLWGDTHFGEALAEALRELGEDVVTCRRGSPAEWARLDDVSLVLRGLHPVPPVPGQVNVLWVISHPDDVDPAELTGYDHVFAASEPWSAELAARTGRRVLPLLQASGFEVPATTPTQDPSALGVVFVGSAGDGRQRPLVRMALDAGVPLAVYGRGWEDLPDGVWRGAYVDNERLPELYREHGIVLADHWPDMARQGFIANRVFDAVASGARVLCDDVVGVHEVFDPRDVVVVRTADEVRDAVAELRRTPRRDDVPRPPLTFRDRARTLLDEVSR